MMQASVFLVIIHENVCYAFGELNKHVNKDHVVLAIWLM